MAIARLECANEVPPAGRRSGLWWLAAAIAAGLLVRVIAFTATAGLDARIVDEQQYVALATSLVEGRGFAWETGEPTSLRPPLYPAFVAAIWHMTDSRSLQAVRAAQIVLAMGTAVLVYLLGRRLFPPGVAAGAAAVVWLYPSLIFLNFNVLGETLFTFLVVLWVLLTVTLLDRPTRATAFAAGVALGLGALTRSVLWPVPLLVCPLLFALVPAAWPKRAAVAALVFAGYAAVVGPWAVRNTRLQEVVTVVDTMGGMNLRMGNYEHTPEDRMWDAVSLTGDRSWVHALTLELEADPPDRPFTEGMKDKWAQRKALEYMAAHPGTTIRRAAIKFADFWGLEREFIAAVGQGLFAPPAWVAVAGTVLILLAYVALALCAAAGLWLTPPTCARHVALLLPVAVITGVHTIVFGHSRYHLPLVPILALYATAAVVALAGGRRPGSRAARAGALLSALLLLVIWMRQVVVDGDRVRQFLAGVL
jgi:4-amino-4-deoxy-L-arabinose transferase-like glycosyltransferase